MSFYNYGTVTLTNSDLLFSNFSVNEVDTGTYSSFINSITGIAPAFVPYSSLGGVLGVGWSAFAVSAEGPGSSVNLTFNYHVDVTNSADAITGLRELLVSTITSGTNASVTATETVTDATTGLTIGSVSWSSLTGSSPVALLAGYQHLNVTLSVSIMGGSGPTATAAVSIIDEGFTQTAASALGAINSYVWYDSNIDQSKDNGETGVSGVTVDLINSGGTVIAMTTTDANGNYSFSDLLTTQTYETKVIAPGGDVITTSNGGIDTGITVTANQNKAVGPTGLFAPTPSVSIVKSVTSVGGVAGDPAATAVGEVIDYSVVVTNTGNETLTNVVVTDPTLGTTLGTLASLAVGASATYTTSQTVTQAELDANAPVTNTATVTDNQTGPQSSTVSTGVSDTPAISVEKLVSADNGANWYFTADDANDTIANISSLTGIPQADLHTGSAPATADSNVEFEVVVTDTGNVTDTNVSVTDSADSVALDGINYTFGGNDTLASLAVGASTVSDVVATTAVIGTHTDTAMATGTGAGTTVTDQDSATYVATQSSGGGGQPDVSIVKTVTAVGGVAGDPAANAAGEEIDYSVVVTNTGNETLTNVVVTDPTLGTTLDTLARLAAGASMTYTTSQNVTQAEIDADAPVTNTATVTDDQTGPQSSTVSTDVTDMPSVSIVKSVTDVGGVSGDPAATGVGEEIDYSVVVTNTGNETLTNVVVTDPTLGATLGTLASLAPGLSVTYTASQTTTQAEIDSGNAVTNTATVTDDQTGPQSSTVGTGVTDMPSVSIVKSVTDVGGVAGDPAASAAGEEIDYSVVVTNTGNQTLTNVVVTDPTLGTTLGTLASLAPNASVTYTASQTTTQAEIDSGNAVTNTATVTDDQTGPQSSTVSTGVTDMPSVSIVKSVISVGGVAGDLAANAAGEVIDYGVVVTNTGNETLTDVVVTDPTLGTTLGTLASLAPGATVTYSTSQAVTQAEIDSNGPVTNTAVVTDDQTGPQSSTVSTDVAQNAQVGIIKSITSIGGVSGSPPPPATYAGEIIDYSVVVTNFGNETLTDVVVADPTIGTTLGVLASLAPGASVTYTTAMAVTQAEIDAGTAIPNTATVTDDETPPGSFTVYAGVADMPNVAILKTVTSVGGVAGDPAATYTGEVIDYNVIVTNTGNETLTNVLVTDPTLHTTLGTLASLAPGAQVTYSTSQAVTQAEIDAGGPVTNVARVTDSQTGPRASTVSTSVTDTPSVSIVKSVTSVGGVAGDPAATAAGETIDYSVVVTNTGNETLTNVVVTDPTLGTTLGTLASLAPNASVTYTTSQTTTQAEIDSNAPVTNTATVTDDQTGPQSSTISTGVTDMPSVSIVKSVTSVGGVAGDPAATTAGEVIDYSIVVTNTGNETLTNVVVTDPTLGTTLGTLASLAVGASVTYTASQTTTQAELNSGAPVTNTATVTDNQTGPQSSTASTNVAATPAVSIVKTVTSVGGVAGDPSASYAGEVINYSVVVSNTGGQTLTNVVVTDPTLGTTLGTLASLAPGASATYTASQSVTQAEINGGAPVTNTATVTDTQTGPKSSTASTNVTDMPSVSIVKTVTSVGGVAGDPAATTAGETINYNVVVTNSGNETLTNVVVTDPTLGTTLGTLASLAPGASATYTASQTVTQAEINAGGPVTNVATVTDTQTGPKSSTASTAVSDTPSVSILKTVTSVGGVAGDPAATSAGEVIAYNVLVTNSGNETLTNVVVTDPTLGTTLGTLASLAPGASATYTASQTVTQAEINAGGPVTNVATVTDTQTGPKSSTASTAVSDTPSVSIVKTVTSVGGVAGDPAATSAGEVIKYNVVVTNSGNETLTNVVVTDPTLGTTLGTLASLAPGASATYTASQTVTQAELDSKAPVTNVATVTDTQTGPKSSTASTAVSDTPSVSILKTVTSVGGVAGDPAATSAGEVIAYSIVVTNSGNETLTNVVVTDPTLGTTLGTLASLAPGATHSYTASQTVTQAELNAGGAVTNTATVTDTQTGPQSSTASTSLTQLPAINIEKLVSADGTNWYLTADDANDTIASISALTGIAQADLHVGNAPVTAGSNVEFEVVVTDTGNVTDTNISVTDVADTVAINGINFTFGGNAILASLAPGASAVSNPVTTTAVLGTHTDTATVTGTGAGQTLTDSDSASYIATQSSGGGGGGITVIKLPCQVVVGTCGQVTYTYDVTNTGTTPVSNVQVVDNIGTAANPDNITPTPSLKSNGDNVGDANNNGVLDPGETWVYTNTINESGDYSSKGGSVHCSVSGGDLSGGCTAWLNSSFTPTSCKDGATYTFQNITCTISGPGCGTITECIPNSVVKFSNSCTQATSTYDSSQNCWVTTLPANCNPGNVFLSGLPYQVPSGCNLSGATVTWNVGQSANNCGSGSVNLQVGCQGYSSFSQNGCDGGDDYNQIGVKSCDNQSGYGDGGNSDQGYGWNYGDSGGYCGSGCGGYGWGSSGCGNSSYGWSGSDSDCAGTPENQYTSSSCGSYGNSGCGGGWGYSGFGCGGSSGGDNDGGGTCGSGSGSGSCSQGQLGDSSEADTVTVTASTLGQGYSLGDAGNYGIIAFAPSQFKAASNSPINGNVGLGASCGSTTVQLNGDKITGNLVTTGTKPSSTGGTVTGSITGNSSTLASDITALKSLSSLLAGEVGTSISLTSGATINATSGIFDSAGDEVFNITKWANNITINGDGTHDVVLNFASGVTPNLDNVTLTGGIKASEVLFNYTGSSTVSGTSGDTFNGILLAPNAVFNVSQSVTINGDLYGGTSGQAFAFSGGAKLNAQGNVSGGTTSTTVTASDSKEVQVLSSNSPITLNGSTPTGSLSSLYGSAEKIEFQYSPSNTVSTKTLGIGVAAGSNSDAMAFIVISNNGSNPFASGATIYFEGEVQTGEKIFADATLNQLTNTPIAAPNNKFSTAAGSDIFAYVFGSQSAFQSATAPIQEMSYNTSGSQAMYLNDQIASLKVVGYVGTSGGHLVS